VGQPAQRHRGQTAVLGGGLVRRSVARRTASRVARAPTEKRSGTGATTELVSTAALTRQVDVAKTSECAMPARMLHVPAYSDVGLCPCPASILRPLLRGSCPHASLALPACSGTIRYAERCSRTRLLKTQIYPARGAAYPLTPPDDDTALPPLCMRRMRPNPAQPPRATRSRMVAVPPPPARFPSPLPLPGCAAAPQGSGTPR